MMLRITLWALFIGSVLMGFLGLKTGSVTTTLVGMGVLAFCAFTLFFIAKTVVEFGIGAVKVVMILVLLIALSFLVYKGCQLLFFKTRNAIEKTDLAIREKRQALSELSIKTGGAIVESWRDITDKQTNKTSVSNSDDTNTAKEISTQENQKIQEDSDFPAPKSNTIILPDTGPMLFDKSTSLPEQKKRGIWDKTTAFISNSWTSLTSFFFNEKDFSSKTSDVLNKQAQINPPSSATFSGVVREVRSGYLFRIHNSFIKLYGIDTPDPKQTCLNAHGETYSCGHTAKVKLERLILNKPIQCQAVGTDGKGNYIATCTIAGHDLGAAMTAIGWAVADRSTSAVYIPYEQQARANNLGLWAGKFVAPWIDRKKRPVY